MKNSDEREEKIIGLMDKATAFEEKEDWDSSIKINTEIIALYEDGEEEQAAAYEIRAEAYQGKGDLQSAYNDYCKAIEITGAESLESYHFLVCCGNTLIELEKFDEAKEKFDQAIALYGADNPDAAWAYSSRGDVYDHEGDFRKALADYNKAYELNEEGMATQSQEEIEEYNPNEFVVDKMNEVEEKRAALATRWAALGYGDYERGRIEIAISYYSKAIDLYENDEGQPVNVYLDRGEAYYQLGDIESAINDFEKSVELSDISDADNVKTSVRAYTNLGLIAFYEFDDLDKNFELHQAAIALYEEYKIDRYLEIADSYFFRGTSHMDRDNTKEALDDYENSIIIFKEFDDHKSLARSYMHRGGAFFDLGQFDKSLNDFNSAIAQFDEETEIDPLFQSLAYNGRGNLHKEMGNLQLSERDYKKAKSLDKSNK